MASAEREPIRGSGGYDPSGVQGQSPWSGAKPPEADTLLAFWDCICELILTFDG